MFQPFNGTVGAGDRIVFLSESLNNEAASQPLNGSPSTSMTAPTIPGWYDVWWLDGQSQRVGQGPTLNLPGPNGVDTVYFYDTDAIGSVRQTTDANGGVVGHIRDFLPFGSEWQPDQALSDDHRVSFTGKERDPDSHLDSQHQPRGHHRVGNACGANDAIQL